MRFFLYNYGEALVFSRLLGFLVYSSVFQHLPLTYCIPLSKGQSSLYEICTLAIYINTKAFYRVNRKQLNILKAFSEYLEFYIVIY